MKCHACGHGNPDGSRFCEECGAAQARRCPSCGHEVRPTAKFCSECGERLVKTAAAASAAPSTEAPAPAPRRKGRPLWGPSPSPAAPPAPSASDSAIVAERRQLTVMFCDLVGSTVLSRRLDPEHLRDVIQAYQSAAAEQIRTFGGYIAQYLGDGLLVYFGYPTAYEDAALRAVHASLAIVDAVARLSQQLRTEKEVELQVRIGIHTGLVVIGDVGADGRHERLAMGDTPNVAARIEGQAPPGGVLISSATFQLVGRRVRALDLGPQQLKGLDKPLKLYRVLGDTAQEEIETRLAGRASRLVGRRPEQQALLDHWLQAQNGHGQAVFLHGEAGIGKSRLVQAVRTSIGDAFRRIELRCSPLYRHSPLYPFISLLQRSADISPDDRELERWRKLERLAQRRGFDSAELEAVLAPLLSIAPPAPPREPLPPAERRERTRELLLRFFFSSSLPTLVIFEDLDWIDPSSREVLEAALEGLEDQALLLLMTGRSAKPPWSGGGPAAGGPAANRRTLELQALEQAQVEELIHHIAGRELPRGLVRLLSDRADGVPVFVEELTRMVIDTGLLEQGEEAVEGSRSIRRLAIPTTLQDSLLARLDRLGTAKGVVQIASTIGREFDFPLLREVTTAGDAELARDLSRLRDAGILLAEGDPPAARYLFRSALLRDAAYGSLLRSHRVELHRAIGRTLERRAQRRNEESSGLRASELDLLAYHWARSLDERHPETAVVAKAADYCARAGEEHLRAAAYHEAGSLLEEARELVEKLPAGRERDERELALLLHLGNVYRSTVGWVSEEVLRTAERARELCVRLGDRPELAPVLHGLWQFYLVRGEFPTALGLADDCRSWALERDDDDLLLESHVALANTQFWIGDLEAAKKHAGEVFAIYDADRHGHHAMSYGQDPRLLGFMFEVWSMQLLGAVDDAAKRHRRLLQLAAEIDHPYMTAIALNVSGSFFLDLRDAEETARAGERMAVLAKEVGFPHWQLAAELYRAWGLCHLGRADEMLEIARDGYRRWPEVIGGMGRTFAGRVYAEVCLQTSCEQAWRQGLEATEASLDIAREFGERVYEPELLRLRGLLRRRLASLGPGPARDAGASEPGPPSMDPELGLEDLRSAHDQAEARQSRVFALRAARDLVEQQQQPSAGDPSVRRLERCIACFEQGLDSPDLLRARAVLSRLATTTGP